MKKWKIALISLFAILLIAIFSFVSLWIYAEYFEKREVYRENSPDNAHTFVLYQVGSPVWPFGPVKAQIKVLRSNGKCMDNENIIIHNDGAGVYDVNIHEIRWYDTLLEVDCTGEAEGSSATYVLEFE